MDSSRKERASSLEKMISTIQEGTCAEAGEDQKIPAAKAVDIALLTGGVDRPYAFGLAMSLAKKSISVEVVGSDNIDSPEMHATPNIAFLNLWPARRAGSLGKVWRTLGHYAMLLRYAAAAKPRLFHILWNSKVQWFDRTVLMLYYKALGKKIALTAHNVNQARRDGRDSAMNRLTLRIQYQLTDRIFVHTKKMKHELIDEFGVTPDKVTVIRHPINDAFPETALTSEEAKCRLGLQRGEKAILFFGRIKAYKGIEHLLAAFQQLADRDLSYRLVIAGEVQKGNEEYLAELEKIAAVQLARGQVILRTRFIPDEEMEVYLKGADVMVLPYNQIFQSGVLFLGYSFGLPVIATDVGSFREEIVEGVTGSICRPSDAMDLARAIESYFAGNLYRDREKTRQRIREHAAAHHSWGAVADITRRAYMEMMEMEQA